MNGEFKILTGTREEVEKELNELLNSKFVKVVGTTATTKEFTVTIYLKEKLIKDSKDDN